MGEMASSSLLVSLASSQNPFSEFSIRRRRHGALNTTASSEEDHSTKLVTFLGKGGAGKTTSAIFADQVILRSIGSLFLPFQFLGFSLEEKRL